MVIVAAGAFPYSPIIDGAIADIQLNVVDDEGHPVPDANVSVAFYVHPSKSINKIGKTNSDGIFDAKGMTIGEISAWIYKDGYYDSRVTPLFETLSNDEITKRRRWSLGTEQTTVILKKKRSPVHTKFHLGDPMTIPVTNKIVALDLESFEWCAPYGQGVHEDLHLFYES